MKCQVTGTVVENREIAENLYKAALSVPEIAKQCLPGQFINVYFPDSVRIFPRPFSIAGVEEDNILLVYKVVGAQTKLMRRWEPGKSVKILGPLGNGFDYNERNGEPVLLGGGVGAAPLMFLRERLFQEGIRPKFFLGAQAKSQLPLITDVKSELIIATDDGSIGSKGFITDRLIEYIRELKKPAALFVCGPEPMMKTLKAVSIPKNVSVFVSLEKTMACGLGLCQGCIVKNGSGSTHKRYSLVCKDGPVFNLNDIEFDD